MKSAEPSSRRTVGSTEPAPISTTSGPRRCRTSADPPSHGVGASHCLGAGHGSGDGHGTGEGHGVGAAQAMASAQDGASAQAQATRKPPLRTSRATSGQNSGRERPSVSAHVRPKFPTTPAPDLGPGRCAQEMRAPPPRRPPRDLDAWISSQPGNLHRPTKSGSGLGADEGGRNRRETRL